MPGAAARAAFKESFVEATGFSNRRHQQAVVSEREQQASNVLRLRKSTPSAHADGNSSGRRTLSQCKAHSF